MEDQRLLSLAAGVCPELATLPGQFLDAAAGAGWRAAGVWFDPDTWTSQTTAAVTRRLVDNALTAVDMEVIRLGPDGDCGDALIDTAAEIGASNVLAISSFEDPGQTAERLAALCLRAAAADIRVCLEFMRFTTVKTLADAVDVVERADQPNAGILVDLLHVARSGTTFAAIAAQEHDLFPYVQWCDGPAEPSGWSTRELIADALDDRSAPGEGSLDANGFERLFRPDVPFSLEVRSKALRANYPDHRERAAAVLAATRRALAL